MPELKKLVKLIVRLIIAGDKEWQRKGIKHILDNWHLLGNKHQITLPKAPEVKPKKITVAAKKNEDAGGKKKEDTINKK